MPEGELLENTSEAGEQSVNRTDALLDRIAATMDGMANHLGTLTEHVSKLEIAKAADDTASTVREGVDDGIDVAGAGGTAVVKSVDVPLAVAQDTVHDTGEIVSGADETTKKASKKLFRKKSRR